LARKKAGLRQSDGRTFPVERQKLLRELPNKRTKVTKSVTEVIETKFQSAGTAANGEVPANKIHEQDIPNSFPSSRNGFDGRR
jgi:hypothetical protein